MIILTRLNGSQIAVNPDLLERVEHNPDTVVSLIDGTRYIVTESIDEIVERVIDFRARVLSATDRLAESEGRITHRGATPDRSGLRLVVDGADDSAGTRG